MDARGYNALLNTFMYGFGDTISRLIDMKVIYRQLGDTLLNSETGQGFLNTMGFVRPTGDLKTIVDGYAKQFKEMGVTQTFDVVEVSDDKIVLDVGMCVFSSATAAFRQQGVKIPPCPIVALLVTLIYDELKMRGVVTDSLYQPEKNSSVFTIQLEQL